MKRCNSFLVVAFIVAGGSLAAAASALAGIESRALDIPLKYERITSGDLSVFSQRGTNLAFAATPPKGNWKLPDFGDRKPAFAMIRLGDNDRLMALDHVTESDAALDNLMAGFGEKPSTAAEFYNRLYFDANANGDLTDDPVAQGVIQEGRDDNGRSVFALVDTTVTTREGVLPYAFSLSVDGSIRTKPVGLRGALSSMCVYSGSAELMGGTEYRVTMADANVNGSFGDCMLDALYLSDDKRIPDRYVMRLTKNMVFGATSYRAEFKADAGKLVLTPVEAATKLRLPDKVEYLALTSDAPETDVTMLFPAQEVSVAQGTYSVRVYRMSRVDEKGRFWIIIGSATEKARRMVTDPDKPTPVIFGEPFGVEFICRSSKEKSRESISMNFAISGSDNERLFIPIRLDKAPSKLRMNSVDQFPKVLPQYEVTDSHGALIAKGRFEFG